MNAKFLHTVVSVLAAFPFQTRATVCCCSYYLLPTPRGWLQEGGTQTVGLGREIKHLNSSSHSQTPQPDATEEDRRQSVNSGKKHPSAWQLLDCVGSLDRYQAEKAQEQGDHGTVLCLLHRHQSSWTEIKLLTTYPSNEKHFNNTTTTTTAQCKDSGGLVLIK